jgi:hypothetical protein
MLKIKMSDHEDCCFGLLTESKTGFKCFVLALPWRDNTPNLSRIPHGTYKASKHKSPKNGECIAFHDVQGRTHIQIHSGNFTYQVSGCFLVGDSVRFLDDDRTPDVTNSKKTLTKLLGLILDDDFEVLVE